MRFVAVLSIVFGLWGHASAAPFDSHCWCRVTKADAGDCNLKAMVLDAGAVATFNAVQVRRHELCAAACDRVLAERPEGDLCAGVDRLGVPLPWGGALRTCSRV